MIKTSNKINLQMKKKTWKNMNVMRLKRIINITLLNISVQYIMLINCMYYCHLCKFKNLLKDYLNRHINRKHSFINRQNLFIYHVVYENLFVERMGWIYE